ncbi:MAG TPA: hypothetical protein VGL56_21250 [Fimbriimonadaceae bacterium]|jgi:hypothetical protein
MRLFLHHMHTRKEKLWVALAFTLIVQSLALASTSILWKPARGAEYRFKWVATSEDYPGPTGATIIRQEETDTDTIKELSPNGNIVTQLAISGVTASMGDKTLKPANSGVSITETVVQRKDGLVVSKKSDSANDVSDPRIEAMERVIYPDHPVNVGTSWSYSEQADMAKGTHDNQSTYTYVGRETVSGILCYKISVNYQEKGILVAIKAKGFIWLSCADGELVNRDVQGENLTVGNGARTFKLHLRTERIGDDG